MGKILSQGVPARLARSLGHYTDLTSLTAQLVGKAQQSDVTAISNLMLPEMIKKPTGFTFPIPLNIYKNAQGQIILKDFDIESYHTLKKGTGKAYYIDGTNGIDTNDGLTMNTAFKTLGKAYSMADLDILYIAGGEYYRQHNVASQYPARNIKLIAYNGAKVYFQDIGSSSAGQLTWTSYGGGVYTTSRGGCVGVFDSKVLDEYNNFTQYVKKTTISDCQATTGTWYTDGTTVYVHTLDGNMPLGDSDIKVVVTSTAKMNPNATNTYYFEGITFEMSDYALYFANAGTLLFKNCTFRNGCTNNGLLIDGANLVICQDCLAYGNHDDGFNYANTNFLEINCRGYANGLINPTSNTSNGSTSHNTNKNCTGVRINGMYFENHGPNVADVQAVGYTISTWNIGCVAYNSKVTTPGYQYDFETTDKQWLDSCVAYGTPTGVVAVGGISYLRNNRFYNPVSGTVVNY
jgi:hypothetical protein